MTPQSKQDVAHEAHMKRLKERKDRFNEWLRAFYAGELPDAQPADEDLRADGLPDGREWESDD